MNGPKNVSIGGAGIVWPTDRDAAVRARHDLKTYGPGPEALAPDAGEGLRAALADFLAAYREEGFDGDRTRVATAAEKLARAALASQPVPALPPGTKLVLMSENLMDVLARPREGYTVTWQWGEPNEHGWYMPTFTEHVAQPGET